MSNKGWGQTDLPTGERGGTGAWLDDNTANLMSPDFFGETRKSYIKSYVGTAYGLGSGVGTFDTVSYCNSIYYPSGNVWVVARNSTSRVIRYSTNNGTSWTDYTIAGSGGFDTLEYMNGIFIARFDGTVAYSTTGTTWFNYSSSDYSGTNAPGVYVGSNYVFAHGNAISYGAFLDIGRTRISLSSVTTATVKDMCYDGTAYFVCFQQGSSAPIVAKSTNLTSWSSAFTTVASQIQTIAFNPQTNIYLVGGGGQLFKSTNGTSWSSVSGHGFTSLMRIRAFGPFFIAVGADGIHFSVDGETWYLLNANTTGKNGLNVSPDGSFLTGAGNSGLYFNIGSKEEIWKNAPLKVFNGTNWEFKPLKRWNGSAWVEDN